jgi:hypothetical protein
MIVDAVREAQLHDERSSRKSTWYPCSSQVSTLRLTDQYPRLTAVGATPTETPLPWDIVRHSNYLPKGPSCPEETEERGHLQTPSRPYPGNHSTLLC